MKGLTDLKLAKSLSLALIFIIPASFCLGQNSVQGPNSPSTATEAFAACLSCPGSDWINPPNVKVPDGQNAKCGLYPYQQCFQTECYYSRSLLAQNFGFTIPLNSIISGIKAEVLRKVIVDSISDLRVMLLQNGDTVGANEARAGFWSPTVIVYAPYGDSTNLWGTNWTPQQIDTSAFGLSFTVQNNKTATGTDTAYVDHIRITVYYTTPTGVMEHQTSDDNFFVFFNSEEQAIIIRRSEYASPVSGINIYNSLGQKVFTKNEMNSGIPASEEIRNLNLREGIYFVELRGSSTSYCKKLLITQ